jgi:hypothetical protein
MQSRKPGKTKEVICDNSQHPSLLEHTNVVSADDHVIRAKDSSKPEKGDTSEEQRKKMKRGVA